MTPALELADVSKSFRPPIRVLDHVSMTLAPAERALLLGANGSGKPTLMKLAAGLYAPDAGTVRVVGRDAAREALAARRQLGLFAEDSRGFYWRLTGRANLEFFGALFDIPRAALAERIGELSDALGLMEWLDIPFAQCSTGVQRRFGLLRAVLHQPQVLLLDEPERSLDSAARRLAFELVGRLNRERGLAVLMATHTPGELPLAPARRWTIRAGRLEADG